MLEVLFLNTFELCAVAGAYNPNIVCIVESWLGDCIFGEEVAIPGYRTPRLDRNRHGGGIIVYVHEALIYIIIPVSSHGMELYSLTVSNTSQCQVCISVLYRPPSSSVTFLKIYFCIYS